MSNRPTVPTNIKRMLWSESMGHCMNPECETDLFRHGTFLGEIAHIKPHGEGGGVSFDNLLILCRNCHGSIDARRTDATEDTLLNWKVNRNDEIHQRFAKAYQSFKELQVDVVPILKRNLEIFRSYGPEGQDGDYAAKYALWLKFEGELIANNQKLVTILEKNQGLLHASNRTIVENLHLTHGSSSAQRRHTNPTRQSFPQRTELYLWSRTDQWAARCEYFCAAKPRKAFAEEE